MQELQRWLKIQKSVNVIPKINKLEESKNKTKIKPNQNKQTTIIYTMIISLNAEKSLGNCSTPSG